MKYENYIGFVRNIKTEKSKTYLTLVLNNEELEEHSMQIGEFLGVDSGVILNKNHTQYLGRLEKVIYKPIEIIDYERPLALSKLNNEILDERSLLSINFMHYEICLLGEIKNENGILKYYPSTRNVPTLVDIGVRRLSNDELQKVVNLSLVDDNEKSKNEYCIGNLQYGSHIDLTNESVIKNIDINNFIKKRTANFGKTGFGKSNENKVLISLLANKFEDLSMLIFDINGEYAFSENTTTAKGLYECFKELGIEDKLVVYTNRDSKSLKINKDDLKIIKPFKMNFYECPEVALSMLYYKRIAESGSAPQYIEGLHNNPEDIKNISNKKSYIFASFRKAGLKADSRIKVMYGRENAYALEEEYEKFVDGEESLFSKMNDGVEKDKNKDGARELYNRCNTLSFLNKLHAYEAHENLFDSILKDLKDKKIVILDLVTIDPIIVPLISDRIANNIFREEQELFAKGECFDTILLIEEAHNLLSDNKGIWYRLAKEGRKYGIGMIYSTQSPKSIPNEILSQTENFFVKHVSSSEDVIALEKAKAQFAAPISDFILNEPVIGLSYVYMEPYQPYVISVKIKELSEVIEDLKK